MNDLVKRLSEGSHPVEISLRPERTVKALAECLDRGWVHIKFTNTRGGTELGGPVNRQRTDTSAADFAAATGEATIVIDLTLDFVPVACVARIDLATLAGTGHLETSGDGVQAVA